MRWSAAGCIWGGMYNLTVMRGLDPRIHVLLDDKEDVDGRNKSGHDE